MRNNRNVVVTGLGIIAPGSMGIEEFWSHSTEARVFTGSLKAFPHEGIRCPVSAEIEETEEYKKLSNEITSSYSGKSLSRTQLLALMGAELALRDSQLSCENLLAEKIHIAVGSTMGVEDALLKQEPMELLQNPTQEMIEKYTPVNIINALRDYFKLTNPSMRMFMNACAAGNYAIGNGFEEIKSGRATIAMTGGVDALSYLAVIGFNRLLSVTPDICRPFDKERKGIVVGEGSAFLLLEEKEHAIKRGAKIYAEISGYGLGVDAYHITSPSPDGRGAIQAMTRALNSSSLISDDIDYVSAHGTGTVANDAAESKALLDVFGDQAPPMSSIKSMLGHTMGAASAIEAAACCLMIKNQEILPTANYHTPDERCPIDCVPNKSRKATLNHVMSNALAFGGNNSSVIFSVPQDSPCQKNQIKAGSAKVLFTHQFEEVDLEKYFNENLPEVDIRMVDNQSLLLMAAVWEAMQTHGISPSSLPTERTAIVSGSNHSALYPSINFLCTALERGALGISPMSFPNTVGNAPASRVSIWLGLRDKVICLSDGAIFSGLDALLTALEEVNKDSDFAWACSLEENLAIVALVGKKA